jgi:hypothetical protein
MFGPCKEYFKILLTSLSFTLDASDEVMELKCFALQKYWLWFCNQILIAFRKRGNRILCAFKGLELRLMLQYHHLLDVILFVKHKFASCERARGEGGQRGERLLKSGMFCYLSLFMLVYSHGGGLPLALHYKTPLVCMCNICKNTL